VLCQGVICALDCSGGCVGDDREAASMMGYTVSRMRSGHVAAAIDQSLIWQLSSAGNVSSSWIDCRLTLLKVINMATQQAKTENL